MTRTHFKSIANIIDGNSLMDDKHINKVELVNSLCDYFECVNDRFNRDLFISACNECKIDKLLHP